MITLRIKKAFQKNIQGGEPWVMTHMAVASSEWQAMPAGLVRVESERGEFLGLGLLNPASHIVCRMLTRKDEAIDHAFFVSRFARALAVRENLYDAPYYRLVHSEADFLPGLVVDRYGDALVLQVTSAAMEVLQPVWLPALEECLAPRAVLLRNDVSARKLEGLAQGIYLMKGDIPPLVELSENDCIYLANLREGQKTGWFYDMRDNRKRVADLCKGKTMLDVFSHSGGFGVLAAKSGAKSVTMVDASAMALDLAMQAARRNDVDKVCDVIKGDALAVMQTLADEARQYEVVVADPPAYVKSRKDVAGGMRGYSKVAQAASMLVVDGGMLFTASCSHHATPAAFKKAVLEGVTKAGRIAEVIAFTGASGDHPVHPQLPQNSYLKGLLLKISCKVC